MNSRAHGLKKSRRQAGYTLMDVMVVTLIIGVLGSLAINRYHIYVARAKRPQTMMAFRSIAVAQRQYLLAHGKYAGTFKAIGFNVEGGVEVSPTEIQGYVYNYRIIQDDGPRSWYVIATGNIDGDPFPDIIAASNPR